MDNLETLDNDSLKPTLEALLLVANDPVAATDLARVLGVAPGEIAQALAAIYRQNMRMPIGDFNFVRSQAAGGFIRTLPIMIRWSHS